MPDLEHAIAEWRQQMLAAGMTAPATLDELESHLREETKQQLDSGRDEVSAFATAAEKIGQPGLLKAEFGRARGFMGWLGADWEARTMRVLSLLWLVYCAGGFIFQLGVYLPMMLYGMRSSLTSDLYLSLLFELIYFRGTIASIRLFGGNLREKRILWFIAIPDAVCGIGIMFVHPVRLLSWLFILLGIFSVWFFHPARKAGIANQ